MNILGVSCYFHDSAAVLLQDGELVAAAEEERFTRKKHDYEFPQRAIDYCLQVGGLRAAEWVRRGGAVTPDGFAQVVRWQA